MATDKRRGLWPLLALAVIVAAVLLVVFWGDLMAVRQPPATQQKLTEQADERFEQLEQQVAEAHELGRLRSVLNDVRSAINTYPDDPRGYRVLAWCYVQMQEDAKAYKQFVNSLKRDPRQPEQELWAGITAYRLDRFDKAVQHCQNAVDLAPTDPKYRLQLANMYIHRQELEKAVDVCLNVLAKLDSSNAEAEALLADIRAKQGNPRQAIVHINRAIERTAKGRREKHVEYVLIKANLLRRVGTTEALNRALLALDGLGEEERYREDVLDSRALCHAMLEQPGKAAELYADAFFFDPVNPSLARKACEWYIKAGDAVKAREYLGKLSQINSAHPMIDSLRQQIEAMSNAAAG